MIDPGLIGQMSQQPGLGGAEKTGPAQPANKALKPDQEDVDRFEQAMGKGEAQGPPAPEQVRHSAPNAPVNPIQKGGMGDSILKGLENLRENHTHQTEKINAILDKKKDEVLSLQDTMRLQMEFMQMNLDHELTTKVADKTGQGVQTLFKNQ